MSLLRKPGTSHAVQRDIRSSDDGAANVSQAVENPASVFDEAEHAKWVKAGNRKWFPWHDVVDSCRATSRG